jgi:hypothetical protein
MSAGVNASTSSVAAATAATAAGLPGLRAGSAARCVDARQTINPTRCNNVNVKT